MIGNSNDHHTELTVTSSTPCARCEELGVDCKVRKGDQRGCKACKKAGNRCSHRDVAEETIEIVEEVDTAGDAPEGMENVVEELLVENAEANVAGMEGLSLVDSTAAAGEGSSAHKASGGKVAPKLVANPR